MGDVVQGHVRRVGDDHKRRRLGEVSPEHDARLTLAGVVGDFRDGHAERAMKGPC
jgi:hypothetical protein